MYVFGNVLVGILLGLASLFVFALQWKDDYET